MGRAVVAMVKQGGIFLKFDSPPSDVEEDGSTVNSTAKFVVFEPVVESLNDCASAGCQDGGEEAVVG